MARAEYNRACRDLIEAYFQVKLNPADRAHRGPYAGRNTAESMLEIEAANAVSRFAALGTYLANFQNEDKRVEYSNSRGRSKKSYWLRPIHPQPK